MKLVYLIILILLISSCATVETGNKFQPLASIPEDKATIYIYRPETCFNRGGWPEIYINNQLQTSLLNNSHIICHVMPGENRIKAEGSTWGTNWYPGPVELEYTFSAGDSYYLRITPVQTGSTDVQNTLTESTMTNAVLGATIQLAAGNLPG
jgi:hypothetical protein